MLFNKDVIIIIIIIIIIKNDDFGAISVTERSRAAPISTVERHLSDRCSYYTR